ncbi:ABC transporter substrate-binding protein [Kitasatospora purpeofusca]|uniref:ABC transporter substrate-binding protein n=1 Tax=Kitasatospora purpeofusca TaxID=67352 RepID=UPI0004C0C4E6|nr:ABC transporter substrate-binding protein [Kitasatospora purpeofusca]
MPRPLARRTLLTAAAASGAALALAACSAPGGTAAADREPDAATPRRGGRLRALFAGGGADETLDPHRVNLFADAARAKALHDKLADWGPDLAAVPRLASGWEPGPGLDVWTVRLREAAFHDGRPVTAADVLYSYRRIADPGRAFRARASLEPIDLAASRATDPRTVEFRLNRPCAEFPNVLAAFGAYIVPEGTEDFRAPVGSGPFSFVSFEPGRSLLLRRFDGYWDGAPHIDELEILAAAEESARANALLAGQAEYAHELAPATARAHASGGRIGIVRLRNSAMQGFVMKTDRPPFDDPRVRQAFFHLVDRQELVDGALSGAGEIGNDLFGKGSQYYPAGLPQRTRDLDRARALLREAGAEGLRVTLDTSPVAAGLVEAAGILKDQAARAGVTIDVRVGNKDTYWKDILDGGVLASFRSGAMPIESHISQRLLSGSTTNATHWRRPDFDDLYTQAQSTADPAARTALYERMQRRLFDEGGLLVWGFADWIVGHAPRLHGVAADAPANTLDWARFDKVRLA